MKCDKSKYARNAPYFLETARSRENNNSLNIKSRYVLDNIFM